MNLEEREPCMSHVTLTALPPTATHLRIISKNARRSSRCSSMVCWCGIHFSRCQCHIWRGCRRLIIFLRCCVSMLVGKGVRCADGTPAYGLDVPGPGTGLGGAQHIMCLDEGLMQIVLASSRSRCSSGRGSSCACASMCCMCRACYHGIRVVYAG